MCTMLILFEFWVKLRDWDTEGCFRLLELKGVLLSILWFINCFLRSAFLTFELGLPYSFNNLENKLWSSLYIFFC